MAMSRTWGWVGDVALGRLDFCSATVACGRGRLRRRDAARSESPMSAPPPGTAATGALPCLLVRPLISTGSATKVANVATRMRTRSVASTLRVGRPSVHAG